MASADKKPNSSSFFSNLKEKEHILIPVKIVSIYVAWKIFHFFTQRPNTALNDFWERFVFDLGAQYAKLTNFLLNTFVEPATAEGIVVTITSVNKGIRVEDHCLAIPAMVIFVGSILAFKGAWKTKAWFIPLGLLGIVIINTSRLIFVALAWAYLTKKAYFDLHHSVIYVVATYTLIFLMFVWWVKKHNKSSKKKKKA